MTTEHPILFSGPMVRAILEGRKTQTRRVVKPQFKLLHQLVECGGVIQAITERLFRNHPGIKCPYGTIGDRLWVRESWSVGLLIDGPNSGNSFVHFWDGAQKYKDGAYYGPENHTQWNPKALKWSPSIHMPRAYSRITLEITDIRVQRLQEISDDDCEAEGIRPSIDGDAKDWKYEENGWHRTFRQGWNHLNAKRGYSWESNPWVWCISFRRIEK